MFADGGDSSRRRVAENLLGFVLNFLGDLFQPVARLMSFLLRPVRSLFDLFADLVANSSGGLGDLVSCLFRSVFQRLSHDVLPVEERPPRDRSGTLSAGLTQAKDAPTRERIQNRAMVLAACRT